VRLAFTAAALLCLGCQPKPEAVRAQGEAPKDAVLHDATLSTWRKDTPVITARAKTVTWYREASRFVAGAVEAEFPSREGAVRVTALRVEGAVAGDSIDAKGGVTVHSARGVAKGPSAHVENSAEGAVISSGEGVQFEGKGQKLTARTFRLDTREQRASFEGVETSTGAAP
jgi:hypothetical protein